MTLPEGWTVVASTRTDDRVNKRYARDVVIVAPHPFLGLRGYSPRMLPTTPLMLALRAAVGPSVVGVDTWHDTARAHRADSGDLPRYSTVSVRIRLKAAKPSEVASEEAAVAYGESLVPRVAAVIEAATLEERETIRRETVTAFATRLLEGAVSHVLTEANAAVRYKQRLAALDAELVAEVAVQVSKALDSNEIEESARGSNDPGAQTEAIDAVRRLLAAAATERAQSSWPREHELRTEDVFPA